MYEIKIEFFNREKEAEEIKNILRAEPTLITFIYGPINSGKTELINYLIKNLPEDNKIFYINLRGRFIKSYEEFLKVLFRVEKSRKYKKDALEIFDVISKITLGIPIPKNILEEIFEGDVFYFLEEYFTKLSEKCNPILIIDELQVIGDVKIDELLVYKLFNFFIRLTKEKHICHVFAITSDNLFLERVYSSAMLQGRARHLIVDDFSKETTHEFLSLYNFSEEEKEIAWNYCGGKPSYLIELITSKFFGKNVEEKTKEMLEDRKSRLIFMLVRNKDKKEKIIKLFEIFRDKERIEYSEDIDFDTLTFLVKQNILFLDPVKRIVKPQSRLDMLGLRDLMG
ncbi:MAG TPA: ATP-binding protein [Methanosarcinales archaeon]|nr:ATP-binding protein [Methanosarcinales archaeon]